MELSNKVFNYKPSEDIGSLNIHFTKALHGCFHTCAYLRLDYVDYAYEYVSGKIPAW